MTTATKPPVALWVVVAVILAGAALTTYLVRPRAGAPNSSNTTPPTPASPDESPAKLLASPEPIAPSNPLAAAILADDAAAIERAVAGGASVDGSLSLAGAGQAPVPPLAYAAARSSPAVVRALLSAGASPALATDAGTTPLMVAAAQGSLGAVQALLAAGAPVDAQNKFGETALMAAVRAGSMEKVALLLAVPASTTLTDSSGQTVVHHAADPRVPAEILHALLDAGAAPDTAGTSGATPLMRAAEAGDAGKCILLLNAGAPAAARDAQGRSARDLAGTRTDDRGARCVELLTRAAP